MLPALQSLRHWQVTLSTLVCSWTVRGCLSTNLWKGCSNWTSQVQAAISGMQQEAVHVLQSVWHQRGARAVIAPIIRAAGSCLTSGAPTNPCPVGPELGMWVMLWSNTSLLHVPNRQCKTPCEATDPLVSYCVSVTCPSFELHNRYLLMQLRTATAIACPARNRHRCHYITLLCMLRWLTM